MARRKPPFWPRVRIQSSLFATVIMNANVLGLSLRQFCTPGFNCHGCAWASCACPIGVIAYGTAMRTIPVLALSTIVAIGIVFGRLVCAFVCPFGFFQDLMHRIPSPKLKIPRLLNYSRYFFLVTLVFVFPYLLGLQTSGYVGVKTGAEEVSTALVIPVVENPTDEPVKGVTLNVSYVDVETGKVVWRKEEPVVFPDIEVAAGEEEWPGEFTIPHMPLHEVDGVDHDARLVVEAVLPLRIVEADPEEQPERLTKVSVRVRNLDTEPVNGFTLNVEYYDEAKGETVWKDDRPHAYPDVTLEPGEAHEAVFFVPLYKTTGEDGEEVKPTLQVTSPESSIVPEAPLQLYYCKVCPTGTLTALIPALATADTFPSLWSPTGLRLGILAVVLVMMVFIARPFCRLFCPLGAIYSLFNRMAFVTMRVDNELCNDCGMCGKACPLDLDVPKDLGAADCIQCGDCITACTRGGITRTFAFPATPPKHVPKEEPA